MKKDSECTEQEKRMKNIKIIVIAVIISLVLGLVIIFGLNRAYEKTFKMFNQSSEKSIEQGGQMFDHMLDKFVETAEKMEEIEKNDSKSFEDETFNDNFEPFAGTKYGSRIKHVLEDTIIKNKTTDHFITVVYQNKVATNEEEIINIKHSLINDQQYELSFDYGSDGYINKINITDIN